MDIDKFFTSKLFKGLILSIVIFIILIFTLKIGIFIGARRVDFSFRWGENYHRNFAGPKEGFFNEFIGKDFINANGVFGQIIKIEGQTLVIKGKDDIEKIVLVEDGTTIKSQRNNIKLSDLKVNDIIVVIGEPNDQGQIKANLIRIMPPPPMMPSFSPESKPNRQKINKY